MKQDNNTTREKSIEWWSNLHYEKAHQLRTQYFPGAMLISHTDIEHIYLSEHPEQPYNEVVERTKSLLSGDEWATESAKEQSSNREEGDILEGISKGEWKIGGTSRGLNNYYIEAGGEKIAQIFSSIPNCEKNADIISKAPELAKENQELRESNTRLKEALQGILNNWDERMSGDKEVWKDGKDSVSGFGYYSPSSSMVSSEFISKAREALNNNNPK